MLTVVTLGDDVLRGMAEKVTDIDETIVTLAGNMADTLLPARGIGLAAPQVGLLKQMFVTKIDGDKTRVFINPSIIMTSQEQNRIEEGCLSIPGVYGDVVRPQIVSVQAWDERGKPFTLDADGMLARVIQHEMDHLKGVLFIDHINERKREKLLKAYYKRPGY